MRRTLRKITRIFSENNSRFIGLISPETLSAIGGNTYHITRYRTAVVEKGAINKKKLFYKLKIKLNDLSVNNHNFLYLIREQNSRILFCHFVNHKITI